MLPIFRFFASRERIFMIYIWWWCISDANSFPRCMSLWKPAEAGTTIFFQKFFCSMRKLKTTWMISPSDRKVTAEPSAFQSKPWNLVSTFSAWIILSSTNECRCSDRGTITSVEFHEFAHIWQDLAGEGKPWNSTDREVQRYFRTFLWQILEHGIHQICHEGAKQSHHFR